MCDELTEGRIHCKVLINITNKNELCHRSSYSVMMSEVPEL
jgi:hypothetical protein